MSKLYGRAAANPAKILPLVGDLSPDGLASFDQLHSGGLSASRLLARLAGMKPGEKVLDAGCGVGGSADAGFRIRIRCNRRRSVANFY